MKRWWAILLFVAAVAVIIAMIVAAIICKLYWNYVLAPPGVNKRVLDATRLLAYSEIGFDSSDQPYDATGEVEFSSFASIRDGDDAVRLVPPRVDPDEWRADWVERGVMPENGRVPAIEPDLCRALPAFIESTADLVSGDYGDGFPSSRGGIDAFELLGPDGEPLLYIAVGTGQLSNDHLAHYELLYDNSVQPPRLIARRYWYRDVAGFEGAEFAVISMGLATVLLAIVLPPVAVALVVRGVRRRMRIKPGQCASCGYSLRGTPHIETCPECGATT